MTQTTSHPTTPNTSNNHRLKSVDRYRILHTAPESDYDDLVQLIADICDAPIAFLGFADRDQHWFKSQIGLGTVTIDRAMAICTAAMEQGNFCLINDTHNDPRFADSPIVTGPPYIRYYAAMVIRSTDGVAIGTFGICDRQPRELSDKQLNAIQKLARQVENLLELRAQADRLQLASDQANRAVKAKANFLANMSHEIRTPLSAVLGYTELLIADDDHTPSERLDYLQRIRRSGEHLLGLISDILDLSKAQAGKITLEVLDCDPIQLLNDVGMQLRPAAQSKELQLLVKSIGPIPRVIRTDPTRLRQVLLNLTSNAVKFTECGSVTLTVSMQHDLTHQSDNSNHYLRFEVVDTGIGIPPDAQTNIFDDFVQVDESTTRRYGGTGLGLAICRHLQSLLNGQLTLQSEIGQGSTFAITIPIGTINPDNLADHTQQAPSTLTPHTNTHAKISNPQQRTAMRVLIAEDCPDNRHLMSLLLKQSGVSITTSDNGEQACEQALAALDARQPFDVILMDMNMPIMNGYEATAHLRTKGYTNPIVALTAHAMPGDIDRCIQAGCNGYLTKPYGFDELIAQVDRFAPTPTKND